MLELCGHNNENFDQNKTNNKLIQVRPIYMLLCDKTRFIFSLLIQINVINFDIVAALLVYECNLGTLEGNRF